MPGLYVEIADTPELRELGLMHRRAMGRNEGMLFVFPTAQRLSFWMKDTYVPLDIAFAGTDRVIYQISDLAPLNMKSTSSIKAAKYALEAPSGWFAANGVRVGGRLLSAQEYDALPFPGLEEQPEPQQPQQQGTPPAAFDAILNQGFSRMIREANRLKLAVVFQYEFPEGKISTYQLVPLEDYKILPGAEGKTLVLGRCANRDGDFRNFDIDKILNYEVYFTEGNDAGKRVVMPMPQLVPQNPEPIPFNQPPPEPMVASRAAEIKTSMDKVLGMVKEAGASGGGSSGQLMMTEYWDYLKKSREEGLSEGQAVLKYLEENSRRNSGKKPKKSKKKPKKK